MRERVLLHVQHLLGIGHLVRAAALARALSARFEVTVVSGGPPEPDPDLGAARLHQLPPVRAGDAGFRTLARADGAPADGAFLARRREALLDLYRDLAPDILVTETFPFGRRALRFEMLPLLAAAQGRSLVVASVRDLLQRRAPRRRQETADLLRRHYDLVLVHGDPALATLADTFPEAPRIGVSVRHTGYVTPPGLPEPPPEGVPGTAAEAPAGKPAAGDVVVSCGGGAVGAALLAAARAARPRSALAGRNWRLLAGTGTGDGSDGSRGGAGTSRQRFRAHLAAAAVSVSQCGYNTAMDILAARCRAVFVPFAAGGETEQTERARRLAARTGGATVLREADCTPAALAAAIDRAAAGPRPDAGGLDMDGAAATVRLLHDALAARARR